MYFNRNLISPRTHTHTHSFYYFSHRSFFLPFFLFLLPPFFHQCGVECFTHTGERDREREVRRTWTSSSGPGRWPFKRGKRGQERPQRYDGRERRVCPSLTLVVDRGEWKTKKKKKKERFLFCFDSFFISDVFFRPAFRPSFHPTCYASPGRRKIEFVFLLSCCCGIPDNLESLFVFPFPPPNTINNNFTNSNQTRVCSETLTGHNIPRAQDPTSTHTRTPMLGTRRPTVVCERVGQSYDIIAPTNRYSLHDSRKKKIPRDFSSNISKPKKGED
jgi:hypothetical protein